MIEIEFDKLDPGVRRFVEILHKGGVETFESCQGGAGHCCPEPMIRFHGGQGAGFVALGIALTHALPVATLDRSWSISDGEPTGPYWRMTFWKMDTSHNES